MIEIEYYRKSSYGNEYMYIKGEIGLAVSLLTKKATVNETDLEALRSLGAETTEVLQPRSS
jgi:hypothetical protein